MAATRKKPIRTPRATTLDPTPRHMWLASLGMVVAARRQSLAAAGRVGASIGNAMADARFALRRAETGLRAGLDGVRGEVGPRLTCVGNEIGAGLAPIVARLGLAPAAKRAPRKLRKAARKQAPRRAVGRPARRPEAKAAG